SRADSMSAIVSIDEQIRDRTTVGEIKASAVWTVHDADRTDRRLAPLETREEHSAGENPINQFHPRGLGHGPLVLEKSTHNRRIVTGNGDNLDLRRHRGRIERTWLPQHV